MTQVFDNGKIVIQVLNRNNYEGYFVGGCVRDYLLKRKIKDVDITTNATPDVIEQLFKKTIDVGKEHGTIIVVMNGEPIEVTTYRSESEYSDRLDDDLKHRDFTMNAIAMNEELVVYDPYEGQADIKNQLIKTVGFAKERFEEDALRMLRALRFSTQLKFQIHHSTFEAIIQHASSIQHVSIERIMSEIKKMYESNHINQNKQQIIDSSLFNFMPVFKQFNQELYLNFKTNNFPEEIATQIYFEHVDVERLTELRISNDEINEIKLILKILMHHQSYKDARILSYEFKKSLLERSLKLIEQNQTIFSSDTTNLEFAISISDDLPIKSIKDLAINGRDIMAITNRGPGPWLKETLQKIVYLVVTDQLENTTEQLNEWVSQHVKD
ncbi:MAG TPA: CCA tRNA nucleotidyltransferase [Aliicoccus persicus]|uniref:CCA tRNA nucleotidyltransferase n=1 Tax=Aliicoccus persicus TaxID=930138 RepID=A0A921DWR4_9STAP|nr:CCA tRNA nucleotidyltransferase [Aliicoccus persicus]